MIRSLPAAVSLVLLLLVTLPAGAQQGRSAAGGFIENRGQWPAEARYLLRLGGSDVWITPAAIVYDIRTANASAEARISMEGDTVERVRGSVIRMEFLGAAKDLQLSIGDALPGVFNYLVGRSEERRVG